MADAGNGVVAPVLANPSRSATSARLADTRLRQVTWPAIAGHHDYIVAQLEAGAAGPKGS